MDKYDKVMVLMGLSALLQWDCKTNIMAYQKYNLYLTCVAIAKIVFKLNKSLTEPRDESMYKLFGKTGELDKLCVLEEGPRVVFKEMNVPHTEHGMNWSFFRG